MNDTPPGPGSLPAAACGPPGVPVHHAPPPLTPAGLSSRPIADPEAPLATTFEMVAPPRGILTLDEDFVAAVVADGPRAVKYRPRKIRRPLRLLAALAAVLATIGVVLAGAFAFRTAQSGAKPDEHVARAATEFLASVNDSPAGTSDEMEAQLGARVCPEIDATKLPLLHDAISSSESADRESLNVKWDTADVVFRLTGQSDVSHVELTLERRSLAWAVCAVNLRQGEPQAER